MLLISAEMKVFISKSEQSGWVSVQGGSGLSTPAPSTQKTNQEEELPICQETNPICVIIVNFLWAGKSQHIFNYRQYCKSCNSFTLSQPLELLWMQKSCLWELGAFSWEKMLFFWILSKAVFSQENVPLSSSVERWPGAKLRHEQLAGQDRTGGQIPLNFLRLAPARLTRTLQCGKKSSGGGAGCRGGGGQSELARAVTSTSSSPAFNVKYEMMFKGSADVLSGFALGRHWKR